MSEGIAEKSKPFYLTGNEQALEEELEAAEASYTQAISMHEQANDEVPYRYLNARASNRLRMKNYADALSDAMRVVVAIDKVHSNITIGSCVAEDLSQALIRIGSAYCLLQQPELAVLPLKRIAQLGKSSPAAEKWLAKALSDIRAKGGEAAVAAVLNKSKDGERSTSAASVTDSEPALPVENKDSSFVSEASSQLCPELDSSSSSQSSLSTTTTTTTTATATTTPTPTPKITAHVPSIKTTSGGQAANVREGWYEQGPNVTVTYYAKGLHPDKVSASLSPCGRRLFVSLTLPDDSTYTRELALFSAAAPPTSTPASANTTSSSSEDGRVPLPVNVTPYKVEIVLKKAPLGPGQGVPTWTRLEFDPAVPITVGQPPMPAVGPAPASASAPAGGASASTTPPASVTSTQTSSAATSGRKHKPTLEEIEAALAAEEEEDKAASGDIQNFLQKIFQNADENTRRAMMKSFQTSNGTVLSTNWSEVEKTDYSKDIRPPQGQVFKKWGEM